MQMNIIINPAREEWKALLSRPQADTASLEATVGGILDDVKRKGDIAVKKYARLYDGFASSNLLISEEEIAASVHEVSDALKAAIAVAQKNITAFHSAQHEQTAIIETMPGVACWRKSIPVTKVGLYIPGGTAPLFSTLLMLGIPALLAGCEEIIVCTPCDKNGQVNPAILYVAYLLGFKKIYRVGGVQAIGAMAFGTETIPAVYKIFGPGNRYVTCAKQLVNKAGIAIDMPAGPSEAAVYADETSDPAFVAADLLSQAEHGPDSQVMLLASSEAIVETIRIQLKKQLSGLPRRAVAEQALSNSRMIVISSTTEAFDLLNEYAAEHLIIASDHADEYAALVKNAGSIFLGHYSPESAGDYASGTNHTLPTNGFAKAYSGVSLDSFVKKVTFQRISREGLKEIGDAITQMAAAEGLQAHAEAVNLRINKINAQ